MSTNNKELSLALSTQPGDILFDNRDNSYFKTTAIDTNHRIILGYKFNSKEDLEKPNPERYSEADIVSFKDIFVHYKSF